MKILIIGGTGFISSILTKKLLDKQYEVTILTRGKTKINFGLQKNLTCVIGDRNDKKILTELAEQNFDIVYDMIAYQPEASEMIVKIFTGKIKRFIHCSTISVYMISDQVKVPITEDQYKLPVMNYFPRNPFGMDYGINKRKCELILWRNHSENFPLTILRPTFVCGPGDPAKRDYFWTERILDGNPLLVPSDGNHKFQQVYVDDAAEAFSKVIETDLTIGKAYNVTGEEVFTLNDYLKTLMEILNTEVKIFHIEQVKFDALDFSCSNEGDVFPFNSRRDAYFDLTKIKADINYRPTPFTTYMKTTLDWFINEYKNHSVGYANRNKELEFIKNKF